MGKGGGGVKWENRAKMEMPRKTWNIKELGGGEKGRVILALKGMESIWAEIKVVILTMQNPFGLLDPDGENTGLLQKKKKKKTQHQRGKHGLRFVQ